MLQKKKELLEEIKKKILQASQGKKVLISIFDADGTLWPEDINHIFLDYLEKTNLRKVKDLLSDKYSDDTQRSKRCSIFAERQQGFRIEEFKEHLNKALDACMPSCFSFQKELFHFLKQNQHQIYIVTASLSYLVKECCLRIPLNYDKIIGVETLVEAGIVTDKIITPLPYGEGKKQAFLQASGGQTPVFTAGNTTSDQALLELSEVGLVVSSASRGSENFPSEQKMQDLAKKKDWFVWNEN